MIGPMLIQSQIPVESCDLIQYRRGGAPWATWQDLPAVPPGYLARGPWVCQGLCPEKYPEDDEGWLWARALDIDEEAGRKAEIEAKEQAQVGRRQAALTRLRDDVRALNYHDAAAILTDAAESRSHALATTGLERVRMDGLRYLGQEVGVRSQSKSELIERIIGRYIAREE